MRKPRPTAALTALRMVALGLWLACGSGCASTPALLEVSRRGQVWLHRPDASKVLYADLRFDDDEYMGQACRWQPQTLAVLWSDGRIRIHDLPSGVRKAQLPGTCVGLASSNAVDRLAVVRQPPRGQAEGLILTIYDRTLRETASSPLPIKLDDPPWPGAVVSWSPDDSIVAVSQQMTDILFPVRPRSESAYQAVLVNLRDMSFTRVPLGDVFFLPDGRIAARGKDRRHGVRVWERQQDEFQHVGQIDTAISMVTHDSATGRILTWHGRRFFEPLLDVWSRVAVREGHPPYRKVGRTRKIWHGSTVLIVEDTPAGPTPSDTGPAPDGPNKPNS